MIREEDRDERAERGKPVMEKPQKPDAHRGKADCCGKPDREGFGSDRQKQMGEYVV